MSAYLIPQRHFKLIVSQSKSVILLSLGLLVFLVWINISIIHQDMLAKNCGIILPANFHHLRCSVHHPNRCFTSTTYFLNPSIFLPLWHHCFLPALLISTQHKHLLYPFIYQWTLGLLVYCRNMGVHFEIVFSYLGGNYPIVQLLDPKVVLFLTF